MTATVAFCPAGSLSKSISSIVCTDKQTPSSAQLPSTEIGKRNNICHIQWRSCSLYQSLMDYGNISFKKKKPAKTVGWVAWLLQLAFCWESNLNFHGRNPTWDNKNVKSEKDGKEQINEAKWKRERERNHHNTLLISNWFPYSRVQYLQSRTWHLTVETFDSPLTWRVVHGGKQAGTSGCRCGFSGCSLSYLWDNFTTVKHAEGWGHITYALMMLTAVVVVVVLALPHL